MPYYQTTQADSADSRKWCRPPAGAEFGVTSNKVSATYYKNVKLGINDEIIEEPIIDTNPAMQPCFWNIGKAV